MSQSVNADSATPKSRRPSATSSDPTLRTNGPFTTPGRCSAKAPTDFELSWNLRLGRASGGVYVTVKSLGAIHGLSSVDGMR
jgi:hypothetical protein